jgi:hypothetical protein
MGVSRKKAEALSLDLTFSVVQVLLVVSLLAKYCATADQIPAARR